MCGIFGVLEQHLGGESRVDESALRTSMNSLLHRGPDAQQCFVGNGFGLAHTRLSLVDLSERSNQPMWDESRRYVLVFNGEIYNFRELRAELEAGGVSFRTTGDTEVLLHALIREAPETLLQRLDGMFAFGFYDTQTEELLLGRDRFGTKPLYFFENDDRFGFASEVKALRPWLDLQPDANSISSYLLGFGGPTQGFTMYRGVRGLAPGTFLKVKRGGSATIQSYFELPAFWDRDQMEEYATWAPDKCVDHMEKLLYESVERQLFADSPVGAFCSGGVDSSVILAMAAKMHSNFAIFHANVVGPWSEIEPARRLSKHLGLDLHVVDVEDSEFLTSLPDVMNQYEHPYTYHPNCAPFMLVSRLVREQGVKGMLSGEGSDELFLGYPWLARQRLINAYQSAGRTLRTWIRSIPGVGPLLWPYQGNHAEVVQDLLNRGEIRLERDRTAQVAAALEGGPPNHHQVTSLDYMQYHLRTLLHRNDSLGMEASIEARFPFLDLKFVEAAINMPSQVKLRYSPWVFEKAHPFVRDKWVVREVANRWIPRNLSQRIKVGFWTTVFQRLQVEPGFFAGGFVQDHLELGSRQLQALVAHADQDLLVRLLHLDVWGAVCLDRGSVDEARERIARSVTIDPV